jgi:CIC family chloride channel protein
VNFSVTRLPDWMRAKMSDGQRFLVLCVATGLLCGLAAVAFHLSIHWLFHSILHLAEWVRHFNGLQQEWAFASVLGGAPVVGGLLVGILLKFCPAAGGSGIPQTKAAYYNNFGIIRLRDGIVRFLLGVISVGSGKSLGREDPTVHYCAAIASRLGRWPSVPSPGSKRWCRLA